MKNLTINEIYSKIELLQTKEDWIKSIEYIDTIDTAQHSTTIKLNRLISLYHLHTDRRNMEEMLNIAVDTFNITHFVYDLEWEASIVILMLALVETGNFTRAKKCAIYINESIIGSKELPNIPIFVANKNLVEEKNVIKIKSALGTIISRAETSSEDIEILTKLRQKYEKHHKQLIS